MVSPALPMNDQYTEKGDVVHVVKEPSVGRSARFEARFGEIILQPARQRFGNGYGYHGTLSRVVFLPDNWNRNRSRSLSLGAIRFCAALQALQLDD
jgi:hypothetical protein